MIVIEGILKSKEEVLNNLVYIIKGSDSY